MTGSNKSDTLIFTEVQEDINVKNSAGVLARNGTKASIRLDAAKIPIIPQKALNKSC